MFKKFDQLVEELVNEAPLVQPTTPTSGGDDEIVNAIKAVYQHLSTKPLTDPSYNTIKKQLSSITNDPNSYEKFKLAVSGLFGMPYTNKTTDANTQQQQSQDQSQNKTVTKNPLIGQKI